MISRRVVALNPVALTNSLTTTQEIPFDHQAGGSVLIPTGSNLTSLTFYGSEVVGGVYEPINSNVDETQNPVTTVPTVLTVSATGGFKIPDACFAYGALKIVGAFSSGTTGNVKLSLKT